ncbi:fatty acid--CoA ligase family protein, partial [bacterium]
MSIEFMIDRFNNNKEKEAIIWKDNIYSYEWLLKRIIYWGKQLSLNKINQGEVVVIEADFSPNSVALFLALVEHKCILVPITSSVESKKNDFIRIAQAEVSFIIDQNDLVKIKKINNIANNELYKELKNRNHPGLVLFSSGSTGESKAAVHDLENVLQKFKIQRYSFRSIVFLLYDHIGGINTMFYNLANIGCIITVQDRTPDEVLKSIERYSADLLPTSPTFINLILLSEAYKRFDISSLKIITYGTEPMPESTLKRFHELYPNIKLLQTYGLSEVGILSSKSKDSNSLWVKVGGEGFETRVVNGILEIKAKSAMLGYLNAPSPFTEDGWLHTGDEVEVDGEYIKILGRKSEMINVGGE